MNATVSKLAGLVWPPTKKKFHRLLHIAGVLATLAIGAAVWLTKSNLSLGEKLGADLVLLVPLLTRWQAIFKSLDVAVDQLPIANGGDSGKVVNGSTPQDEITKPEKQS